MLKTKKATAYPRCLNKVRKLLDNNMLEISRSTELFPFEILTIGNKSHMADCSRSCFQRHSDSWGCFGQSGNVGTSAKGWACSHRQSLPGEAEATANQVSSKRISPQNCGFIFHPSDTKEHTGMRKEAQLQRKGRRSEKEQQINPKQKYKQRWGNSGKVVSPACFFQTQQSDVWKVMNQGSQARTGATRLNCMTWGADGKLEQREGKQRKLSDFCGHYHAACAPHKTFIVEDALLLWFGIQNLDQI